MLTTLALCFGAGFSQGAPSSASRLEPAPVTGGGGASYEAVRKLIAKQQWPEAITLLSTGMSNGAAGPEPLLYRGTCLAAMERWHDAREDFSRATEIAPSNAEAWLNRGQAERVLHNYSNAVTDFSTCLRLAPTNKEALLSRAATQDEAGKWQEAVEDTTRVLAISPADEAALCIRAHALFMDGKFAEASKDYALALELNPDKEIACNGFAWLLASCPDQAFRNGKKALGYAQRACTLSEWKDWTRLETLAAAFAQSGQYESAVEMQRRAIKLLPPQSNKADELSIALRRYEEKKPYLDGTKAK